MRRLAFAVMLALASLASAPSWATPRDREILRERPSGFWTSNRPAEGGAYRWRMLGIGGAIAGVMGIVIVRVLRSARAGRTGEPRSSKG